MTEAEWLAATDPTPMLEYVRQCGILSARTWRLFSVACCHRIRPLLCDARSRHAVLIAERYADGGATTEELHAAYEKAFDVAMEFKDQVSITGEVPEGYAAFAACDTAHADESADDVAHYAAQASSSRGERTAQIELLRDIFGNPLRPVAFDPEWLTSTAVALARQMYDSRDFSLMPILADALQDAGCDNDDLLNHCRGPGPHVRGCWVVDLILGKR